MRQPRALQLLPDTYESQTLAPFKLRLTDEQTEALWRCANGISLRFEASAIVDALVNAGYAEMGVARVVTVTPEGKEYLETHAIRRRPCRNN